MKPFFIAALTILSVNVNAQKGIDGLINAEKSFAAYSVEHGAKQAFLKYLDSNGVVFDQGKAVNGIQFWSQKKELPFVLSWYPQIVEIANSNDFGYTTGPWELRSKDSVIARGQFTTVWHLDKNGEWKFLVDLGVSRSFEVREEYAMKKVDVPKVNGDNSLTDINRIEMQFNNTVDSANAYVWLSDTYSVLQRNNTGPAIEKLKQSQIIRDTPLPTQRVIEHSGISSTGDLAYTYGNSLINGKPDNYLHIWRREKSGWRIALEVLRY